MRLRLVLPWVIAPLLVTGAALAGGYWVSARSVDVRSDLNAALDTLPDDTLVAGFTDWASIRRQLDLGAASTAAARASLNDDAALRDLSTRSVLGRSVEEMHQQFGWSAADLDWEVYGQAQDGAAMVGQLSDAVSLSDIRATLRTLGYERDGRVWTSTSATPVTGALASTLASVAIIPGRRLVVAADRETYVRTVLRTVDRDQSSLLSVRPAAQLAQALDGADSALIQSGPFACVGATLEKKSADVQAQARAAIARSGKLADFTFAARAITDVSKNQQELSFAMEFASPTQAAEQLRTRRALARGAFIGGSGRMEDSLQLSDSRVDGTTALMRFDHDPATASYMTGDGPLLFASCP